MPPGVNVRVDGACALSSLHPDGHQQMMAVQPTYLWLGSPHLHVLGVPLKRPLRGVDSSSGITFPLVLRQPGSLLRHVT